MAVEERSAVETVENRFLDGRLRLLQPVAGYRAATDPVLLAASVDVSAGASVLDLGCGVGAAALCLGSRIEALDLHGLELQPVYADLARENGRLNSIALTVHEGDMQSMPDVLKTSVFDAVLLNPPWHDAAHLGSPDPAKDRANRRDGALAIWLDAALGRIRPGGWLHLIQRVEYLPEILAGLTPGAGDIAVLPLAARTGRPAKRVIVRARKGAQGPFRLAAPLVLHAGEAHLEDGDDYTAGARAILRGGAGLTY